MAWAWRGLWAIFGLGWRGRGAGMARAWRGHSHHPLPVPPGRQLRAIYGQLRAIYEQSMGNYWQSMGNCGQSTGNLLAITGNLRAIYGHESLRSDNSLRSESVKGTLLARFSAFHCGLTIREPPRGGPQESSPQGGC
eukprot:gene24613-biopygen10448